MPTRPHPKSSILPDGGGEAILVAIYRGHLDVLKALDELARSHVDLRQVSVVGTDFHTRENVYGYYSTSGRLEAWGSFGAFWSSVCAALSGSGFFFIPGLGPLVLAGPVVGWLVAALGKGVLVDGLSSLGAALAEKGVPPKAMHHYEVAVRDNEFLLVTSGPLPEVTKAGSVAESTRGRVDVYPL
jgi:hypothetical protein